MNGHRVNGQDRVRSDDFRTTSDLDRECAAALRWLADAGRANGRQLRLLARELELDAEERDGQPVD